VSPDHDLKPLEYFAEWEMFMCGAEISVSGVLAALIHGPPSRAEVRVESTAADREAESGIA
jgi:hypothetical protein